MNLLVIAVFVIGAAFMIHYTGRGSSKVQTAAGWIVGAILAVVAGGQEIIAGLF